jgi:hypothetical protein
MTFETDRRAAGGTENRSRQSRLGDFALNRRLLRSFMLALAGASSLLSSLAFAAPKDAAVIKIDRDAIYNDYLATKFPNAEKKLRKAIAMCAAGGCSPRIYAQLHRDLGIVYVVSGRTPAAQGEFAQALQIDPSITLVKELNTPEIQATFNAARAGGGGEAPAEAAPEPAAPGGPAPRGAGGEDMTHTPPAEQTILTPVPLYAEMPEGVTPAKVQARYKPFGATEWKTIDLRKLKSGYGGEVPCLDIGSETGDLKYYIQAIDANGDVVATSGTRNAPHKVPIKNELAGEPPHLPGRPPPAQCANPGDCPPGLPGCASGKKKKTGEKEWGASCELDSECRSGACRDGTCAAESEGGPAEAKTCEKDGDCASGQVCTGSVCSSKAKKNFLSVSIQQDMLLLSSATEVCANQTDYTCFYSNNSQYGTNGEQPTPDRDQVSGGFGLATTRILVGFDRLFGENLTLGVKLGYAFNGGPAAEGGKAFLPVHAEARVAYFFGKNPFGATGIRPYVTANGGVAQIDARVTVQVTDQLGQSNLAAWKKGGTSFVGAGVGAMWLTSPGSGFVAELRLEQLFSSSATGVSLQLGYAIGL